MTRHKLSNSLKKSLIVTLFFPIINFSLIGCKDKDVQYEAGMAACEAQSVAYSTWKVADFKKMMNLCKKGGNCLPLVETSLMSATDPQNMKKVSVDVIKFLLENGASADVGDTLQGQSPLASVIVSGGSIEIVRELLNHKARVKNVKLDGSSALHMAVKANREDVINLLLKLHPELIVVKDKQGHTPLDLARTGKRERLVALLQPPRSKKKI
jgi:ankyrin repeat protein